MKKEEKEIVIRALSDCDAVRTRPGMYVGAVNNPDLIFREVIDGSFDESYATGCNKIIICTNFNGYYFVSDNGRGIPITMSIDDPSKTQAFLAIAKLHAGANFNTSGIRAGMHGCGEAAANFLSERFVVMSRITENNWDKSIPEVRTLWESSGPRIRKELYYLAVFEKGILVYEGAHRKCDAEKMLFKKEFKDSYAALPEDMSTMVFFRPDPTIFDSVKAEIPESNLQNFLLIQEKYYGRKINIWADGRELSASSFKPYRYEFIKTIVPADTSLNDKVTVYVTFDVDKELGSKVETGSVNGLTVNQGIHLNWIESFYEEALRQEYKIKHRCIFQGFKVHVLLLAGEVLYDSQTKTRLRSISKVKSDDLKPDIVKEFIKIFRKYSDDWQLHVDRLNLLADSMKSISAVEKAQRMIDNSTGLGFYKSRSGLVDGFADATAKNRWDCELFLCFTGDTEILTCNDERIRFDSLVKRIESGEEIYTFSCTSNGKIIPAKIIAAKQIKEASELCKITLDNGESFTCTPEHEMMLRDGSYKMAKDLVPEDSLMPCYITYSDNYDSKGKRRVILDMCPGPEKSYRPDKFSLANGGKLRPVFHVMSEHSDAERDESAVGLTEKINKHHKDGDKLNDNPRNLLLCSSEKHFSFHAKDCSYAAHKKAHEDPELYKKIYIDNKRTESFKLNASIGHKNYFKSEEGSEMKNHLREKSIKEWSSERLRKWRSEETKKYAREHPERAKANSKKSKVSFWSSLEIPEIKKFLQKECLEFNSYNFNLAVLLIKSNLVTNKPQGALKFAYWDTIVDYDSSILSDFTASDMNISPDFIRTRLILERLKKNNTSITIDNYNKEVIKVFESGSVVTQGKGYERAKKLFPDLLARYSAEINNNHKIISVEFINIENTPVYCLEVDTPEHNFPLAAGIFTKNCEGLSPAGSLKSGRRPVNGEMRVAVLPLKGKILNVSDASIDKALDNKEIKTIFTLLGVGIQENNVTSGCKTKEEAIEALKKYCRYGKICISCDADSDGSQITSLILYMFSKFARFLIEAGCVYISLSPLFEQDGKYYYPNDPIDRVTSLPIGIDPKKPFRRWKGVGSVAKELIYDSFFNPSTRRLIQVTPEGMDYAMKLTEDIDARKTLLRDVGILTNPYNFTDL